MKLGQALCKNLKFLSRKMVTIKVLVNKVFSFLMCPINNMPTVLYILAFKVPSQLQEPSAVPSGDRATLLTLSVWFSHMAIWVPCGTVVSIYSE
jgi:hypothetical protein